MSTETTVAQETVTEIETNEQKALKLTRRYALWSMGGGLIPIIGLDIAAILAAQLKMLSEISKVYGVEFKENRAKSIVTTLIGSLGIYPVGTTILFSVIKIVPIIGPLAAAAIPFTAGAVTYATGKVFIKHFESGGTFIDCSADKMKSAYKKAFDEGKKIFSKKDATVAAPAPAAEAEPVAAAPVAEAAAK